MWVLSSCASSTRTLWLLAAFCFGLFATQVPGPGHDSVARVSRRLQASDDAPAETVQATGNSTPPPPDPTSLFYAELLEGAAGTYGKLKKQGMLDLDQFSHEHFNVSRAKVFAKWIRTAVDDSTGKLEVPPMTRPCGVWVNHDYKLIFIRNRKAASTSLVDALGGKCPDEGATDGRGRPLLRGGCMEKVFGVDTLEKRNKTAASVWKDYLVFGVTRNVWARAASGYDYETSASRDASHCFKQCSFKEFAADPMCLAKDCYRHLNCCTSLVGKLVHLEPSARCFRNSKAQSVVDYVLRYEHLADDFAGLVRVINKRRSDRMKKLQAKLGFRVMGPIMRNSTGDDRDQEAAQSELRHIEKFLACGPQCASSLAQFYREDVRFFNYTLPQLPRAHGGNNPL